MSIKTGPKKIAKSTGEPDKRQRDNKETPGNTPSLKPHVHKKGKQTFLDLFEKIRINLAFDKSLLLCKPFKKAFTSLKCQLRTCT